MTRAYYHDSLEEAQEQAMDEKREPLNVPAGADWRESQAPHPLDARPVSKAVCPCCGGSLEIRFTSVGLSNGTGFAQNGEG